MWTKRFHTAVGVWGLLVAGFLFAPAATPRDASRQSVGTGEAPVATTGDAVNPPNECTNVYDFERQLIDTNETRLVEHVKEAKRYIPQWAPSRRRGLRRAWTTFYSVHSDEAVPVLENKLPPAHVFDELFRCRGFGTTHPLDPRLIEAAIAAAKQFKSDRVEVISGYRSPKFNDSLAKKGRHVATESKHTLGQALDIRIVSAPAAAVGKWLFDNFDGGVGTYTGNNFVHIDVGPKRRWRGR